MSTDQNSTPDRGASTGDAHTPLTPPPSAGPTPPTEPGTSRTKRGPGVTAIIVSTAVVGGFALLGTGATAAVAAGGTLMAASSERSDSVQTVDADGVRSLDLDVDAGNMRVEFGDVDEARLSVTNGRSPGWTLDRTDDEIVVRSPDFQWGWWFGSWFGDEEESAVLTLPESLKSEAIDASLTLDAGSLDVVGDFGLLDVDISAGALDVEGSATTLDIDMSAGRADVILDGVTKAGLGVSAGDLVVELTGDAPEETRIDVSAGSVDLTVPDESYTIEQDISAGSLDAKVDQSSGARHVIDVSLSAGDVTIRPGR